MADAAVQMFAEVNGSCPLLEWLDAQNEKVRLKCIVRIERLSEEGHRLRRPEADFLRDGIHELRVRMGTVNYRMLYFFHDQQPILSHGLTKEDKVPDKEINLAIQRKQLFENDPDRHTYKD